MPKLFAGLDVGDQTTSVCIVDEKEVTLFEASVATTPAAIGGALKSYRRTLKAVGLEAGSISLWLHRELGNAGYPMRLLDARRAHALLKTRINKTDANDAHGLALLLSRGVDLPAHARSDPALRLRALLTFRAALVAKAVDLRNGLKMTRKVWGSQPGSRRKVTPSLISDEQFGWAEQATCRAIDALTLEAEGLRLKIEELAMEDLACRRMMTIPGVGPMTALTFLSTIDDPTRFKSSRDVAAYLGLTPRMYQSGKTTRYGRVSKRGHNITRGYLYQASVVLLHRSKSNCRLRRWGLRLAKEKGNRKAYVACARKLAVLMHRLWVTGEDFDPAR